MRRLLCLSLVLLAGCQNVLGPRYRNYESTKVDNPCLTIAEQKRLGRDRLALPEMSKTVVPRDYSDFTGPYNP
jgi:hypothetical protein